VLSLKEIISVGASGKNFMFQSSKLGFIPLLGMVFLFGISILCQAEKNSEEAAHRAAAGAEKSSQGSVPGTHPPKVEITDAPVKILGIQETEASQRGISQVAASSVNPQELERLRAHAVEKADLLQKATTELFDTKRRLIEVDQVDRAADLAAQEAFEKHGRDHVLFKEANEAADRAAQLRAEKALEFKRAEEAYETALDAYKKAQRPYSEARYSKQFASLERRVADRAAELERKVAAEAAQVEAEAAKYLPKDVAGIKAAEAVEMAKAAESAAIKAGNIPLANAARTLEKGIIKETAKISPIGHVLGDTVASSQTSILLKTSYRPPNIWLSLAYLDAAGMFYEEWVKEIQAAKRAQGKVALVEMNTSEPDPLPAVQAVGVDVGAAKQLEQYQQGLNMRNAQKAEQAAVEAGGIPYLGLLGYHFRRMVGL